MTTTQQKTYNVLFLCTGNSSRSIMAEALLNIMGRGRFKAYSAGSRPAGAVNPLALEHLHAMGYPLKDLRSKSWDEFASLDAPEMDFIITVCDNAAGEVCPVWPGQPISAHWSFEDPTAAAGTEEQKRAVFSKVARQITTRVNIFASLPFHTLEKIAIKREMDTIGAVPV
jgi:arsenate reductase